MASSSRPLSPHLGIYRWSITMALSILHRASGVFLGLGVIVMVVVFASVAAGDEVFHCVQSWLTGILGRTILFGWTLALYLHMTNGVRHLVWDMGLGLSKEAASRSGVIVLIFALVATLVTWWIGYSMRG